ncbi:SulP family inorganic anion transporter [Owenweeksia hongkongensis]|uniref:SulP family inorganic anion transporter n=1 Tax=Owenweeksia hongkongensis TaxID=253245 RepID=UPI003A94461A
MNNMNFSPFKNLKHDLPASIVVFLVALPLCLGIALASGAPLFSGIIAGIVGGIVVAALSGSPLGVSGPAAGLAVIVLTAIQDLGFEPFLLAVVIGGLIQLILGFLRAGIIGYYFPTAVIKGMLSGIGIIIILKQIPHAFGYDADPEGDMNFIQPDGHNTFSELSYMLDGITPGALIVCAISLAILILWEQKFIKNHKILSMVQGPLLVVLAGIGLSFWFDSLPPLAISGDHMVSIPVAQSVGDFFNQFSMPDWGSFANPQIYVVAFTIAIVASLETLLCVEATDKLDPYKRVTPTNRELKAQGVGNIISGLIGGIPITQVIVRSSANIQSGGRTKASAFLHGVLMLVFVMAIPNVLNKIPLASLAAILFLVGYKLAKPVMFKEMYRKGWSQFIPYMVTIIGIVFTDLLIGITMGMVVAIFQILWKNYQVPYTFESDEMKSGGPVRIQLAENVSFLNKAGILNSLNSIPDNKHVIIDGSRTKDIHPDIIEIIEDFKANALTRNITVESIDVAGVKMENPVGEFERMVKEVNGNNTMDTISKN